MNARLQSLALIFVSLTTTASALANEGGFEPPGTLEFGTGVMVSDQGPTQGLFQVNVSVGNRTNESYFIWAKIKGTVGKNFNGDAIRYMDVSFEGATFGQGHNDTFYGISLIKSNLYKNLDLGQGLTARIQFLGVQGSVGTKPIEQVELYFKGALELLGMNLDANHATVAQSVGIGAMGGSVEAGVRLFKSFRFAIGGSFGNAANSPLSYMQNPNCQTSLDSSGNAVVGCSDGKQVTKQLHMTLGIAALSWLNLGLQANYVVYQKDGQDEATAWQTMATATFLPSALLK